MAKKKKKVQPKPQSRRQKVFDPEGVSWFVPAMFGVFILGLVILFSKFIFSDLMLYGSDTITAGIFFRSFLVDYFHQYMSIPQWNPYIFGGMPYVEAFHGDIFYPLSFLKYFGSIFRMLGFVLFFHIILAGIFMYFAAREFSLSKMASLMASVCYMYSAWLISLVAPGHDGKIFVTTLYPLTILFLDKAFRAQRRNFVYFTALGLVLGVIILSPHPQMSYYTLWSLAFYTIFRLIIRWRETSKITSVIAPGTLTLYAVVIGLLISAIQFYPGYYYTSHFSPRADQKSGWEWATSWSLHEEDVMSQLIPEFVGTSSEVTTTYYWGENAFKDNSESVGPIAILFAIIGAFFYRRKEAYFFGGLALFALVYALADTTPLFRLFYWLIPKVKSLRAASMIMFLFSFSVSLLAGMGLQYIIDSAREKTKAVSTEKKFQYVLFGVPGFLLLMAFLFTAAGRAMINLWTNIFYADAPREIVQQGVTKLDLAYLNLPAIQSGAWWAFLMTALASVLVWLYRTDRAGKGILIVVLLVPMIHGARFNNRFVDTVQPDRFWSSNPVVTYLQEQPGEFRVYNEGILPPSFLPYHGISVVSGYHGNQLRWYEQIIGGIPKSNIQNPRVLNLLGTQFLLASPQDPLVRQNFGPQQVAPALNLGNVNLYRNPNAFPRVYLVDQYQVFDSVDEVYKRVIRGSGNLRQTVYLEEEPSLAIPSDTTPGDRAAIEGYGIDTVAVTVQSDQNKLLIWIDNYYDAWKAYIDGEPAPVMRAYGSFKAVAVPADAREVIFRFESDRYQTAKMVTLLTTLFTLGVIVTGIVLWRREESEKVSEVDE